MTASLVEIPRAIDHALAQRREVREKRGGQIEASIWASGALLYLEFKLFSRNQQLNIRYLVNYRSHSALAAVVDGDLLPAVLAIAVLL